MGLTPGMTALVMIGVSILWVLIADSNAKGGK